MKSAVKSEEATKAETHPPGDALGNRDPRPGASPGYDEQQAPDAATARKPGGRRRPHNEDGGVGRDLDAEPQTESLKE